MKKVYIVQLNNPQEPIYPEVCAICGLNTGEPLVALSLDTEDPGTDYLFYQLKKDTRERQPFFGIRAHHQCIRKVQYRLLKSLFLIILAAAAITAIGMLLGFGLFTSLIPAVIIAGPLFYLMYSQPLPVEYFFHEKDNLFSFMNRQYAEEFARLNHVDLKEEEYRADLTRSFRRWISK
ncbi:MAG: hypothetical protein JW932_18225 [Deltaproteobacteria bacterium]|nr:hypothetical protein [Deltaproteobacteria bacterium]